MHLSVWEISIILILKFNIARMWKKTEILNVPNVNYETQNTSESLKSLLKESLDTALPFSPLFPAPLR